MAKRRGNNEGSLFRKANGSWRAMVSINGKRLSFTAKSRQEAEAWRKKTITQIDSGMTYSASRVSLEEYLISWLSVVKTEVRKTTWSQYELSCRIHICPCLGTIKLKDIEPAVIQKFYNHKISTGDGRGIRTIRVIHGILKKSLQQAVRLGMISKNPVDLVNPPRYHHEEMKYYDKKQVQSMLIAAQGDRNEALYFLAVTTGCRMSELLGLKWSDLNWEIRTLRIQRQLSRKRNNGYFVPLKTKASYRTIDLGQNSLEKLREHFHRQNHERIVIKNWVETDLIFPSSFGTPLDQFNLYHCFKSLIKKAGLPEIRFHDLRHTAATLMINDGVPIMIVSKRLGHSKIRTTMDIYAHLLPDTQREYADRIDGCVLPIKLELHPNCTQILELQNISV